MDVNKVTLIGRVSSEIESKEINEKNKVCNFSFVTNRSWGSGENKKEEATFHNITAWGKLSEICERFIHKGSKLYLEGRIQNDTWEKQDGSKGYRTVIVADQVIMLDNKTDKSLEIGETI